VLRVARATVAVATTRGWSRDAAGAWSHGLPDQPGVAYLRIHGFGRTTVGEVERALAVIAAAGARSLVIDLRHNQGGLLTAAIAVADLFVDAGTIVALQRREHAAAAVAAQPGVATTLPLALLVDGETKSAAEVLAACLQDHRRAVVVGGRSFGKGTVQQMFPVASGGAVLLTVEHYRRPSGRPIERHFPGSDAAAGGVWPDDGLAVAPPPADAARVLTTLLRADDDSALVGVPLPAAATGGDPVLAAACAALARTTGR
jgi:carboxyl-terminal processing protease